MKEKNSMLILLGISLLILMNSSLLGQNVQFVRGKIINTKNESVANARIMALDSSTGFSVIETSANDGSFTLNLPTGGPYHISISLSGYQSIELPDNIKISQGDDINLKELTINKEGDILNEVVVKTKARITPFTSKSDVGLALSIGKNLLDQIPTPSRDFKSLATLSPQASIPINKERYGISLAGVKSTAIGYTIDGVNVRRGVFGGTSQESAFIISMEAIEEFKVETNNYSVVGPRNGGGSIQAITASGTNELKGAAWGYYTSNALSQGKTNTGQPVGGPLGNAFSNLQVGAKLSGAIIKNKLTFFALYDVYSKSAPDGRSLLNYDIYTAQQQQNIDTKNLTDLITTLGDKNVLENKTLEGQTGTFQKSDVTHNAFVRLDWQINQRHKLTGRISYLKYDGTYDPTNVNYNYMLKERRQGWAENSIKSLLALRSSYGNGMYNDLKLAINTDNRFLPIPGTRRPSISVGMGNNGVEVGSPWWGGEEIYMTQYQLIDNFSFRTDNGWDFIVGTDNLIHQSKEFYPHYTGGVVSYNNLDDMKNNKINSWERLVPTDGGDVKRYYEYPLIENSIYVQTTKFVHRDVKLELGLRWDAYFITKKSLTNQTLVDELGVNTPQGISSLVNIQPRVNITWDIKGAGKDIIKFGIGAFSNEWTTHPYTFALRTNGIDYRQVKIDNNNTQAQQDIVGDAWTRTADQQIGASDLNKVGLDVNTSPTDIYTIDKDLKTPTSWKTNLTYTHYFTDWFRLTASGYYNVTVNQTIFQDINITEKKDAAGNLILAKDGRVQYDRKSSKFNQVLIMTNAKFLNQFIGGTLEASFFYKDGVLNLSYTAANVKGESPYGTGSAWIQGQGIPYSYDNLWNNVGNWNSGYTVNNKFVALFSSPTYYGFSVAGTFLIGQYQRFSAITGIDMNGIQNEGGGDGRVLGGDLAFVYDPTNPTTPANIAADMKTLLEKTSPEYKATLEASMGKFIDQNTGVQPWQYQTTLTIKKVFNLDKKNKNRIILRADFFNLPNLLNSKWGYNDEITNLNLYQYDKSTNTITINPDAGTKRAIFYPELLGRIQFGLRYEF